MPPSGPPLAALAGLWLVGRLAMVGAGYIGVPLAVAGDALFLPVLVAVCARELVAGKKVEGHEGARRRLADRARQLGFHPEVLLTGAAGASARGGWLAMRC